MKISEREVMRLKSWVLKLIGEVRRRLKGDWKIFWIVLVKILKVGGDEDSEEIERERIEEAESLLPFSYRWDSIMLFSRPFIFYYEFICFSIGFFLCFCYLSEPWPDLTLVQGLNWFNYDTFCRFSVFCMQLRLFSLMHTAFFSCRSVISLCEIFTVPFWMLIGLNRFMLWCRVA